MDNLSNQFVEVGDQCTHNNPKISRNQENAAEVIEKAQRESGTTVTSCPAPGHRFARSSSASNVRSDSNDDLSDKDLTEERALDVDQLKTFVIPKKKKAKKDLFEDVTAGREFSQDIKAVLTRSYKDPSSDSRFKYTKAELVHNTTLETAFVEKRKKLRSDGYSEKETIESYAFLCLSNSHEARKICKTGINKANTTMGVLGHPEMGVYLSRHADILRPSATVGNYDGAIVIFKIIKGKVKAVPENFTTSYIEPTPNCDCHISKTPVDLSWMTSNKAFESSQIYIYEYNEDFDLEERPSQVCPYALVEFTCTGEKIQKSAKTTPQRAFTSPPSHPSLSKTPVVQEAGHYSIWTGQIVLRQGHSCHAELRSFNSYARPARIGREITLSTLVSYNVVQTEFLSGLTKISKQTTMTVGGRSVNYCMLLPCRPSDVKFEKIVSLLQRSQKGALVKLEQHRLIVLACGELSRSYGLEDDRSRLHCLFISNTVSTNQTADIFDVAKENDKNFDEFGFTPPRESPMKRKRPLLSISKVFGIQDFVHVDEGPHGDVDYRDCKLELDSGPSKLEEVSKASTSQSSNGVHVKNVSANSPSSSSAFHEPPKLTRTVLEDPFDTGFISFLPQSALVSSTKALELIQAQGAMQKKRNIDIAKGLYQKKASRRSPSLEKDNSPASVDSSGITGESSPSVVVSLPLDFVDPALIRDSAVQSKPVERYRTVSTASPSSMTSHNIEQLDSSLGYEREDVHKPKYARQTSNSGGRYDGATLYRSECATRTSYDEVYSSASDGEQQSQLVEGQPITMQDFHKCPSDGRTQKCRNHKRLKHSSGSHQTQVQAGQTGPRTGNSTSDNIEPGHTDLSDMVKSLLDVKVGADGKNECSDSEGHVKNRAQKQSEIKKTDKKQISKSSQNVKSVKIGSKKEDVKLSQRTLTMFDLGAALQPQLQIKPLKKKKKISKEIESKSSKTVENTPREVEQRSKKLHKSLEKEHSERKHKSSESKDIKRDRKMKSHTKNKEPKIKSWVESNRCKLDILRAAVASNPVLTFKIPKKAKPAKGTTTDSVGSEHKLSVSQDDKTSTIKKEMAADTDPVSKENFEFTSKGVLIADNATLTHNDVDSSAAHCVDNLAAETIEMPTPKTFIVPDIAAGGTSSDVQPSDNDSFIYESEVELPENKPEPLPILTQLASLSQSRQSSSYNSPQSVCSVGAFCDVSTTTIVMDTQDGHVHLSPTATEGTSGGASEDIIFSDAYITDLSKHITESVFKQSIMGSDLDEAGASPSRPATRNMSPPIDVKSPRPTALKLNTLKFLMEIGKKYGFFADECYVDPDIGSGDPQLFDSHVITVGRSLADLEVTFQPNTDRETGKSRDVLDSVLTVLHKQSDPDDDDDDDEDEESILLSHLCHRSMHFKHYKGDPNRNGLFSSVLTKSDDVKPQSNKDNVLGNLNEITARKCPEKDTTSQVISNIENLNAKSPTKCFPDISQNFNEVHQDTQELSPTVSAVKTLETENVDQNPDTTSTDLASEKTIELTVNSSSLTASSTPTKTNVSKDSGVFVVIHSESPMSAKSGGFSGNASQGSHASSSQTSGYGGDPDGPSNLSPESESSASSIPFGANWKKRMTSEINAALKNISEHQQPKQELVSKQEVHSQQDLNSLSKSVPKRETLGSASVPLESDVRKIVSPEGGASAATVSGGIVKPIPVLPSSTLTPSSQPNMEGGAEHEKHGASIAPSKQQLLKKARLYHPYKREVLKKRDPQHYFIARDLNELMQNMTSCNYTKRLPTPLFKQQLCNMPRQSGASRFKTHRFTRTPKTKELLICPDDLEDLPVSVDQIPNFEERKQRAALIDESKLTTADLGDSEQLERSFYEEKHA